MLRITDPDDLPRILWRLGVSYYADGTYTDPATGCAYTYFKADAFTPHQVRTLRRIAPSGRFGHARAQYAPEQVAPIFIMEQIA